MKLALPSLAAAVLALGAAYASADAYTASIQGCQKSINERLGAENASYSVKKIQTTPRYRDIDFRVTAENASTPVKQMKVSCRATQDGEVLAVKYDEAALPAVATH